MKLRIAVSDDENKALAEESCLIKELLDEKRISYDIEEFLSAEALLLSENLYDMIFLDVEMDGLNGLETAERIHKRNRASFIFFVTNHECYMDKALDSHAFRFFGKPMNRIRLEYGIQSAIKKLATYKTNIVVTVSKKTVKILAANIIYTYHEGRFTHIVTTNGIISTYDTFQSVVEQLTDECFFETHASCYVNLNYVSFYNRTDIVCEYNGKTYSPYISTRKYSAFNKKFMEWGADLR